MEGRYKSLKAFLTTLLIITAIHDFLGLHLDSLRAGNRQSTAEAPCKSATYGAAFNVLNSMIQAIVSSVNG